MENLVQNFTTYKKYSNLIGIGKPLKKVYVYKYMTLNTALECLKNNTFRFSIPSRWKDPYESRFYNANYDKFDRQKFDKRLYACCVTENKLSESAWKMYIDNPDEHCIKFSICIGQLRTYLNKYAKSNNALIYEGRVNYSLNDSEINRLHLKSSQYHSAFFDGFNREKYLNLMLIKRHLFYHEGEIRYMYMGGNSDFVDGYIDIELPWSLCLNKISIDNNLQDEKKLKEALENNYTSCVEKYSLLYKPYVPIEIENIYKPFRQIVIEK